MTRSKKHRTRSRAGLVALIAVAAAMVSVCALPQFAPDVASAAPSTPQPVPTAGTTGTVTRTDVAPDRTASGATCGDYSLPVTLKPGRTERYQIFGRLCSKSGFTGRPVQLLLHGGTYNHTYWDWPYQPERYNYTKYATDAGYVTLAIDRLGYGLSDRPLIDADIDFESDAWVAHQVVQYLRAGSLGAQFTKVAEVGHSLGSGTAFTEAGRYRDVDALVVSGGIHNVNYVRLFDQAGFYPASLDPKFKNQVGLAHTYLTTVPGARCRTFYYQPDADPGVCRTDEQYKDTFTGGELTGLPIVFTRPTPSDQVTAPVLLALGQHDAFTCFKPTILEPDCSAPGSNAYDEAKYYPRAKSYQLYIEPRSGHNNNLHLGAVDWFHEANRWIGQQLAAA